MKVVFIYFDFSPYGSEDLCWTGEMNFGIAALSAALKANGIGVGLIHLYRHAHQEQLIPRLHTESPDLIAISSTSNKFGYVKKWAPRIKKAFLSVPVVVGGPHPTLAPEETIGAEGVDMICIGEGDEVLVELARNLEQGRSWNRLPSLWVKTDAGIIRNPVRPLVEDLNTLPDMDRGLFRCETDRVRTDRVANVILSRGCPFLCAYCSNHAIKQVYPNPLRYVRFPSPEKAVSILRRVVSEHPAVASINFHDDILFLKKAWFEEFADRYRGEIGLPFSTNLHPLLATPETIHRIRKAGGYKVQIGIESGNEKIRNRVLNRRVSDRRLKEAFRLCKDFGIQVYSFNIIGIPTESIQNIYDTIKFNAGVRIERLQYTIFFPYENTALHRLCVKEGYLPEEVPDSYNVDSVLAPFRRDLVFRVVARYFKALVRLYTVYDFLPNPLRAYLIRMSDAFFQSRAMAPALLAAYPIYHRVLSIASRGLKPLLLKALALYKQAVRKHGPKTVH